MLKIDSHQHFWQYDPVKYDWIDDGMSVIRKDFLPKDLQPILNANDFDGCIAVQAHQSEPENESLLAYAEKHTFIKGIVGWIGMQSAQLEERLVYYQQFKKIKGFRHVLQGETQRDFMLRPDFIRGISLLKKYNYTYDILILPDQLTYAIDFVSRFPDQPFIIDHIAKPDIKSNNIETWRNDITAIGRFENVFCKVSGMVTEANWKGWKNSDFYPYLDAVVNAFGVNRVMFGSDWPVCNLAANYKEVVGIVGDYFSSFSDAEQKNVFGENAAKFYKI